MRGSVCRMMGARENDSGRRGLCDPGVMRGGRRGGSQSIGGMEVEKSSEVTIRNGSSDK